MPLSKTALVVETNYLVASVIEDPLRVSGFRVIVAVDEDEARVVINSQDLEVAVIDFRLAHGGPDGLVRSLEAAGVPYLFCTASSTEEVAEHFPKAAVLQKPFDDKMLLAVLQQVLEGRSRALPAS